MSPVPPPPALCCAVNDRDVLIHPPQPHTPVKLRHHVVAISAHDLKVWVAAARHVRPGAGSGSSSRRCGGVVPLARHRQSVTVGKGRLRNKGQGAHDANPIISATRSAHLRYQEPRLQTQRDAPARDNEVAGRGNRASRGCHPAQKIARHKDRTTVPTPHPCRRVGC